MVIEEGVQWERLRAPPIDTPAHELHVSDCLSDLRPGDHIEIQWRRNKEFPYGECLTLILLKFLLLYQCYSARLEKSDRLFREFTCPYSSPLLFLHKYIKFLL